MLKHTLVHISVSKMAERDTKKVKKKKEYKPQYLYRSSKPLDKSPYPPQYLMSRKK